MQTTTKRGSKATVLVPAGQCTVAEAAAILGRSAGSVMRFGERGHLTRIQIAKRGTITFHRSEVVELARRLGVEV